MPKAFLPTPLFQKLFPKNILYFRKHLDEEILFEARRTTEGKVKAYLYVSRTALEEQHSIGQNIKVEHLDEEILFEARRTTEGKVKAYLYVSRTALEEQHSIGQNIKVELGKVGFRPFPLLFIIICSSCPRSLRRRTDRPVRRRSDRPYYSDQSPDPARSAVRRASRLPYRTPFQQPRYQP